MRHNLYNNPNVDRVDDDHDFCSASFRSVPEPLLTHPTSPPTRVGSNRIGRVQKTMAATRSSLRLAARPSSVPVAERAQRKLMRELDFIDN